MSSGMIRVFVILCMTFGVVIEELCPSPLLFLFCGTIWYLNDDEDIGIFVGFYIMFFVNQN